MKILVIEDNAAHVAAAQAQLVGHDLTVVQSADEALELLGAGYGKSGVCDYEVVLTDLLMPSPRYGLSEEAGYEYAGQPYFRKETKAAQEVPVGNFFALIAAKNGAKYVGVLTDSGHHDHPASALLDAFRDSNLARTEVVLTVNGAKLVMSNAGFMEYKEMLHWDDPVVPPTKRWDWLLAFLVQD